MAHDRTSLSARCVAAAFLLLISASLMEIAVVTHFWGGEALVWLFTAKWLLILIFDLPPADSAPGGTP